MSEFRTFVQRLLSTLMDISSSFDRTHTQTDYSFTEISAFHWNASEEVCEKADKMYFYEDWPRNKLHRTIFLPSPPLPHKMKLTVSKELCSNLNTILILALKPNLLMFCRKRFLATMRRSTKVKLEFSLWGHATAKRLETRLCCLKRKKTAVPLSKSTEKF